MGEAIGFVEIDGRRFDFERGRMVLSHCASSEADWLLELRRPGDERSMWLGGTVKPSPKRVEDLPGVELVLDNRDLDALFEVLLEGAITIYPGGEEVCRATARVSEDGDGLRLSSGFEFGWDRALDDSGVSHPEVRRARMELVVVVDGMHAGTAPE